MKCSWQTSLRSVLFFCSLFLFPCSYSCFFVLQLLEIFAQAVNELVKRGFLKWPKVYIDPSCASEVPVLQSMVPGLKGETAASSGEPPPVTGRGSLRAMKLPICTVQQAVT